MIFETNEFLWIKSSYDTTKENNLHELLIVAFVPKYPVRNLIREHKRYNELSSRYSSAVQLASANGADVTYEEQEAKSALDSFQ